MTTSPRARSIPETFPQVSVTSPYSRSARLAAQTFAFSSSSIFFPPIC